MDSACVKPLVAYTEPFIAECRNQISKYFMTIELIIPLLLILAMGCQWLAWRIKLPAIVFLLLAGLAVGPITNWIDPDAIFGNLLMPMVSLSVAIILFEGSLTLNTDEIKGVSKVVQRMITVGALVTWVIVACATHFIFDFSWQISALFGAIVIVTGPTVIVPMLRSVRPTQKIANILRWEGIAIDPIGALMAVLTYEFILVSVDQPAISHIIGLFLETVAVGVIIGIAAGWLLGRLLTKNLLPEYLHNFATLSLVLLAFSGSNALAHESGLIAVTVMGMWLANRTAIDIHPILNFKEHLSILLISMLFIILAARIDLVQLSSFAGSALLLLFVLQFIARPAKILVSTLGLDVSWRERALLSWIAPRGIVAAAISAIFADRLVAVGYTEAALLVPLTFSVIIGTVVLQSFTAGYFARLLGVAEPEPIGFLIVGASAFPRALAKELVAHKFRCLLVDSNTDNIRKARMEGLEVFYGNPVSEHADIHMDLTGIGRLLALSRQRSVNIVSAIHFRSDFGNDKIFRLPISGENSQSDKHRMGSSYQGQTLFSDKITHLELTSLLTKGLKMRSTKISEEFDWLQFENKYKSSRLPLFEINAKGRITPFTTSEVITPTAGSTIIAIETVAPEEIDPSAEKPSKQNDGTSGVSK